MKLEKLYDNDGEVKGYKLGDYYLMKHYCSITNNNLYTWKPWHLVPCPRCHLHRWCN